MNFDDLIQDQGEVAIRIDLDEQGNFTIDGYKLPDSEVFSTNELAETFVMAARPSIVENQPQAAEMLDQYINQQKGEDGTAVYCTWRENIPNSRLYDSVPNSEKPSKKVETPNINIQHKPHQPKDSLRTLKRVRRFEKHKKTTEEWKRSQPLPRYPKLKKDKEGNKQYVLVRVYGSRKYKPVAVKVRPVKTSLPEEYRVERNIIGDPLKDMPVLPTHPPKFTPGTRYTQERKEVIDKNHDEGFLWPQEMDLVHHLMKEQEEAFAWEPSEGGTFREDFFPPVKFPVVPHEPWVEKNIPIPPGVFQDVCQILRDKIDAGVYEPSSSSYRSKWFCVLKKDGKSLRIVHSLEPLNAVTIQYSGIPPATADVAREFAGRACGGTLDVFVGYDERNIEVGSRDLTTFQTPFGPYRLVKLPMGWTNSVPIFHDDMTAIYRDEIPHITRPYVDDVPVKGPESRYEKEDGTYETIPENPGIRRFVWEHMQNMNRIIQRMKYMKGTFSGKKAFICCQETMVLGHKCSYEGRTPDDKTAETILTWPACRDKTEVRAFLGTAGQLRMFVHNYAKKAAPLIKLTGNVPFEWGPEQDLAMKLIKDGIQEAPCLKPINYSWDVHLVVDTSYKSVGWYIYQIDPNDPKKKFYNYFGSMTLNEREARFSQAKREFYGLKLALEASYYQIYGCRRLTVATDASYIKGMLDNPSCGPNATINRWIEDVRRYHFTLIHVKGTLNGLADGLSRITPGGYQTPRPPINSEDYVDEDDGAPIDFVMSEGETERPYDFDEFKDKIDSRTGFYQDMATCPEDFEDDLQEIMDEERQFEFQRDHVREKHCEVISQFQLNLVIPEESEEWNLEHPYSEDHRAEHGKVLDDMIPCILKWYRDPDAAVLKDKFKKDRQKFIRQANKFFIDKQGRLYRRNEEVGGRHRLFVPKDKRMYMLHAAHDHLGHKGVFATRSVIEKRFWWPDLDGDVAWFVKTCQACQDRQLQLIKAPPTLTYTPSLFQKIHVDTMKMTPASNGCNNIVHGRCALSSWSEGRALRNENSRTLGEWFFEDIICRWGCPEEVVTDNAPVMKSMLKWLENKYGIRGIRISAYNSQANGKIERAHFDIRQALVKATGGNLAKWWWFLNHVFWADRITTRRGFGCSPYFLVTGAEPILPLDIVESTWLVKIPDRILTHSELLGYRAQALAKHRSHVMDMIKRVDENKRQELRKFELEYGNVIKDYDFKPGTLVQVRHSQIEKSLDSKNYPRYRGPMVVIRRTRGGSYVIAEMDGTVLKEKVGAFRVLPHFARYEPIKLPENIHDLIDLSSQQLEKMLDDLDSDKLEKGKDFIFDSIRNLRIPENDTGEEWIEDEEDEYLEVSGESSEEDEQHALDILDKEAWETRKLRSRRQT